METVRHANVIPKRVKKFTTMKNFRCGAFLILKFVIEYSLGQFSSDYTISRLMCSWIIIYILKFTSFDHCRTSKIWSFYNVGQTGNNQYNTENVDCAIASAIIYKTV